jgi:uncharacterized membrane protein
VLEPAVKQMSEQAAQQALDYAKAEGPRIAKEQVLPRVLEATGADEPKDIIKQGVGKVGEAISDSGGVAGMAGKVMAKVGGGKGKGKGGGTATGWGQKRRMPVQQDVWVSVSVEDAYKGWTEYSRWSEFMHRPTTIDAQMGKEEGDEARLKITERIWLWKRPFTSQVTSQVPNEHIKWNATEGTKNKGVISFHGVAPRLTLISVNLDHAPAGPIEKMGRGMRFVKRAVRADLHRFKGWIEVKSDEDIADMEGWLGTIEDGQIVQTHEQYMEENPPEEENGDEAEDSGDEDDLEGSDSERDDEDGEEDEEGGSEGDEEDDEEDPDLSADEDDNEADEDEDEDEEPEAVADEDADPDLNEEPPAKPKAKKTPKKITAKKPAKKAAAKRPVAGRRRRTTA